MPRAKYNYKNKRDDGMLTTRQVAVKVGLKVSTIRMYRHTGEGPAFITLGPQSVVYDPVIVGCWMETRKRKKAEKTDVEYGKWLKKTDEANKKKAEEGK